MQTFGAPFDIALTDAASAYLAGNNIGGEISVALTSAVLR